MQNYFGKVNNSVHLNRKGNKMFYNTTIFGSVLMNSSIEFKRKIRLQKQNYPVNQQFGAIFHSEFLLIPIFLKKLYLSQNYRKKTENMFSVQTLRVINHIKLNQKQIKINHFIIPPANEHGGGRYIGFSLSVCLSVRLSVPHLWTSFCPCMFEEMGA